MAAKQKSAHQPPDLLSLCLAITEHAPLPMATVEGASHIVRYVNPAFCRLLDKPSEQLVGIPFCKMLPERDECVTLLDRVFHTGKPESHTEQEHSKPHPVFWSFTMWPVLADERPVGVMIQVTETAQSQEETLAMNEALMLGMLRQHELTEVADSLNVQLQGEITERKLIEAEQKKLDQRLRDQQFYTRSLIESNIDALMTTDPSGIITDVNKQMEALTGCTRDELIGAPFKDYFTDPERAEAGIKLVLREKKITDYELTGRARDGKETEVSYNATTFYDRGRTLQGVFAAARDVTERKQRERDALSLTNEISHRIKNNLQVIVGLIAYEAKWTAAPCVQGYKTMQARIGAIAQLYDLISQTSRGQTVAVDAYLREIANNMSVSLLGNMSGIEIEVKAEPLEIDPNRAVPFGLLVNELTTNAIKHAFPHGSGHISLCVEQVGDQIELVVSDDGVGIKNKDLVKSPEKRGSDYVAIFVRQLGGAIVPSKQEPTGTTVRIRLPLLLVPSGGTEPLAA